MSSLPLELYGDALAGGELSLMRRRGGDAVRLPVDRWLGPVTAEERTVLDRARSAVLDVGCGPGRHVHALARRGMLALGLDLSPAAVRLARRRGAEAVQGDVFGRVPGQGAWKTVLLLDGNIGMGGCPIGLLSRVATVLAADGVALVELDPPGTPEERRPVRIELEDRASAWFHWGTLPADRLGAVADRAGFSVAETWSAGGRWFAELERA